MLVLDTTSAVIRYKHAATLAGTTGGISAWADTTANPSSLTEGRTAVAGSATLNTYATVAAAPAASTIRDVVDVWIQNPSTNAADVFTVEFYDGATAFVICSVTLNPGDTLHIGKTIDVIDATGNTKLNLNVAGAANLIYATPNGGSGSASLRAMVAADMPNGQGLPAIGTAGKLMRSNGTIATWDYPIQYVSKSAPYTVLGTDNGAVIDVDAGSAAQLNLITLPQVSAANKNMFVRIRKQQGTNLLPITGDAGDGINGTGIAANLNIVSFTVSGGGTGTAIVLTVSLVDPRSFFVVGGVVNVTTGTAIDGAFVITALSASTISYTRTSTTAASTTTGKAAGVPTWLIASAAYIDLMSTGTAGTSAGQGWLVVGCNDYISAANSGGITDPGSGSWHSALSFVVPPGDWDFSSAEIINIGSGGTATVVQSAILSSVGGGAIGDNLTYYVVAMTSSQQWPLSIPSYRSNLTIPTVMNLNYNNTWATVAPTIYGRLSARRVG